MASVRGKHKGATEVEVRLHKRHPGQAKIAAHPARFRVVMCGRRWGKSACGIREASDIAIAGQPVGWFSPTYKLALEAWRELVERLAPITARMNEQDKRLELVTGGVIEVWTLDTPDAARGRKYALVVIDEAGIARDLLEVWQAAIRPTLVDLRGRALILGTPKGRRHGFVVLFNRGLGEDPDWASFRASTLENPYIPADEVEAARKELPPEVFAQEFEGIPTDDGIRCPYHAWRFGPDGKCDDIPYHSGPIPAAACVKSWCRVPGESAPPQPNQPFRRKYKNGAATEATISASPKT
jgi:hypothetical protein